MELVEEKTKDVMDFFTSRLKRWNSYFKGYPTSLGMTPDKSDFNHIELLNRSFKEMIE